MAEAETSGESAQGFLAGDDRRRKILLGGIAAIFILVLGGLAYFFGFRGGPGTSPTPTPTPALTPFPSPLTLVPPSPSPTSTPTPKKTPTPTPTPTPVPTQTKALGATASLDGFRASNGGGNAGVDVRTGRNVNLITRGFVSFELGEIPAGATIKKATLRLYQAKIIGNPYGVGARVMADHLDYGTSLGNEDYGAASISASFATLTENATIEWKDAIVTDQVKNDITNGRTRSQYRIHFAIETIGGDVTGDFAYFESADNSEGTGNTPQLVVEYQ